MPEVQVNYLGVFLAGLAAMVVGSIWYSKPVFGKMWMKMVGLTDEKQKSGGMKPLVIAAVLSFITAYVLAHTIELSYAYFGRPYVETGLITGFWLWLGIAFTQMVMHDAFEQRPMKLTFLNVMSQLVTLLAMGLVLGLVR